VSGPEASRLDSDTRDADDEVDAGRSWCRRRFSSLAVRALRVRRGGGGMTSASPAAAPAPLTQKSSDLHVCAAPIAVVVDAKVFFFASTTFDDDTEN
jgi:hypothetical protein